MSAGWQSAGADQPGVDPIVLLPGIGGASRDDFAFLLPMLARSNRVITIDLPAADSIDELVIHGSTGSPWMRALADGAPAAVSVTALDGLIVARSGFESSFRYRSAAIFGVFDYVPRANKVEYLNTLTDSFLPGRVAEVRESTRKELAATLALRMPIGEDNWSLKVSAGFSEDPEEDVAAGVWAGVVPMTLAYGAPILAPDCDPAIPIPESVRAIAGLDV